jgi:hypothetical protein
MIDGLAGKGKVEVRTPVMPRRRAAGGSITRHIGEHRKAEEPPVKKRA